MRITSIDDLLKLLHSDLFYRGNVARIVRIFYGAAKIIYYRQRRLGKSQLKMKQISSALILIDFHNSNAFRFSAEGDLAANFRNCPENKALEYYQNFVMGALFDSFGRLVVIDEQGIKSLYKEPGTGRHIVDPANYEEFRGKRLPWIRHTIANSRAVYCVEETIQGKFRRTYLYTAIPSIPRTPKPLISYFLVVVSEQAKGNLKFVTAYPVSSYNRFLCYIEPSFPFGG